MLLPVQASVVRGGRSDVHRRVGPYGAMLAVVMVALGILGALVAARRATGPLGSPGVAVGYHSDRPGACHRPIRPRSRRPVHP